MGDKLLKKLILTLLISAEFLLANANVSTEWIDTMVSEIQPQRMGVSSKTIAHLKNPFIMITKETKKNAKKARRIYQKAASSSARHRNYRVSATLNKSAKINNRWYHLNSKIGAYKLTKVTQDYVILSKGKMKPLMIYLNHKNKKIQLKTK